MFFVGTKYACFFLWLHYTLVAGGFAVLTNTDVLHSNGRIFRMPTSSDTISVANRFTL